MQRNGREAVTFQYVSPDGEEGFPGTVRARLWYSSWEEDGESAGQKVACLETEYEVELIGGAEEEVEETVVGVTNHRYVHFFFHVVAVISIKVLSFSSFAAFPPESHFPHRKSHKDSGL